MEAINDCDINPMESKDLMVIEEMEKLQDDIKATTSPEELERFQRTWEAQQHLVNQLAASLKQATKELNTEVRKAEANKKKVAAAQEKKRVEEEAAQKKEQVERAKKQVTQKKESHLFLADFEERIAVQTFETQDRFMSGVCCPRLRQSLVVIEFSDDKWALT